MKVVSILIALVAIAVIAVPQYTNCEYGNNQSTQLHMQTSHHHAAPVLLASMGEAVSMGSSGTDAGIAAVPYRMMKCYWAARAEVVAGAPLLALALPLFFWRRKGMTRIFGGMTALMGVLVILIPTALIGTCMNSAMVCNTAMKPMLLFSGGILIALGAAVVVMGELRREDAGPNITRAA